MKRKKRKKNEIDEIFQDGKKEKEIAKEKEQKRLKIEKEKQKKALKLQEKLKAFDEAMERQKKRDNPNPQPLRYDNKLKMKIYRESDLNLNKGGRTKDCPFDCWCCF